MDFAGVDPVRRRELADLLHNINGPGMVRALLLGEAGAGKTVLLEMLADELKKRRHTVLAVKLPGLSDPNALGGRIITEARRAGFITYDDIQPLTRTIRTSIGFVPLGEAITLLSRVSRRLPSPVVLLDGLDESREPSQVALVVEELALALERWKFVVSSRPRPFSQIPYFAPFRRLLLRGLTDEESASLLLAYAPELSAQTIHRIVGIAKGNPLILRLLAQTADDTELLDSISGLPNVSLVLGRLVDAAISHSPRPATLSGLLQQIASDDEPATIAVLIYESLIHEQEIRRLLGTRYGRALVTLDNPPGTAAFIHDAVKVAFLARHALGFNLADLKFGAEEAERDELLVEAFVQRPDMDMILGGGRSIIVGDRGSGKSAIFRRLAEDAPVDGNGGADVYPVTDAGDLLHRIVASDSWLNVDALRAAWLVVAAAVAASSIPASAPERLRRDALRLRAALGLPARPANATTRLLRTGARLLGGTSLNLAVGPVSLQATLPAGVSGRPGSLSVDVESFLQDVDALLQQEARRAIIMFDRIDETFKYDRAKQQAIVQALLQAEGRVSLLRRIGLVIFLRTDIVELYDIQEKNKLVSRMLMLDWSDDDWLQVMARRALVNEPLRLLSSRLQRRYEAARTRSALAVLFPAQIEGQPADRWLIDSLRNGNGDISPRLAVLLLHLTREISARPGEKVSTLPIFSAEAAGRAMTRLSDLSFSEVVNDFKVAPSFVLNCRAGKLASFTLAEVMPLFDKTEGKVSEQVRLLERLGFLERVVQQTGSDVQSRFRIPRLYARCWDYA